MASLQYYINQRNRTRRDINSNRARVAQYNGEISRLENAYSRLKSIKNDYTKPLKNDVKLQNLASGIQWRGQYKNDFDGIVDSDCKESAKNFNNDVDHMMEIVSNAIRDKKNQRDAANGNINALTVTYNWICSVIRNWID